MVNLRYSSMLAALSLAGAAYAQTQATPDQTDTQSNAPSSQSSPSSQTYPNSQTYPSAQTSPSSQDTNPSSASSPHQRGVTSQSPKEAPAGANPDPSAASTPHQQSSTRLAETGPGGKVSSGMEVQSESGEPLGVVIDIIPGPSDAHYVVIATPGGNATPVPYSTAKSMVRNDKLVIDRSRFDKAPKVQQSEDRSSQTWQNKADNYWGKKGSTTSSDDRIPPDQGQTRPDHDRSMSPDSDSSPPR
jgi:hypothetical protein